MSGESINDAIRRIMREGGTPFQIEQRLTRYFVEVEPRPSLVEYRRVVEALNLCLAALHCHDVWCGHLKDAPGDSIYRRAEEAAKKALWPTS